MNPDSHCTVTKSSTYDSVGTEKYSWNSVHKHQRKRMTQFGTWWDFGDTWHLVTHQSPPVLSDGNTWNIKRNKSEINFIYFNLFSQSRCYEVGRNSSSKPRQCHAELLKWQKMNARVKNHLNLLCFFSVEQWSFSVIKFWISQIFKTTGPILIHFLPYTSHFWSILDLSFWINPFLSWEIQARLFENELYISGGSFFIFRRAWN